MQIRIQRIPVEKGRRVIAVSDIHGRAKYLNALLEKVHYTPNDSLFIVGDIVEKGLENLQTLRRVMELAQNLRTYCSLGNVDLHRLVHLTDTTEGAGRRFADLITYCHESWGGGLFEEMMAEAGLPLSGDPDKALVTVREHFQPEIQFLESLPVIMETEDLCFVHGGLPGGGSTAKLLEEAPRQDIWKLLKYDAFYDEGFSYDRYVVVGHWPTMLTRPAYPDMKPVINEERKIIMIDGGCGVKEYGQLNALIVEDHRISTDYYLDFPWITAKVDQAESESSFSITFADRWVRLLGEESDGFIPVRHESTGYEMLAPAKFVHRLEGDRAEVFDATDYCLPVRKGDRMQLLDSFGDCHLVNKNGVIGWYKGDYGR